MCGGHAACLVALACNAASSGPEGPDPAAGALSVQLTTASASSNPGSTVTISVSVTAPAAYTGGVALAADGLPAGVTLVSSTVTTSGTTLTGVITLQVSSTATPGAYTLNVKATGTGVSPGTATFALTIQAAPSEAIVRFVPCGPIATNVVWFAYLNADATWTQVTGSGGEYRFPVPLAVGVYAYVSSSNGSTSVVVNHLARAELTAGPIGACTTASGFGLNRLTGTISPALGAQEVAFLYMGASGTSLSSTNFTFTNGPDEPFDLVATRGSNAANGYTDRIFLRRDVTAPNGSSLGVLDFNGPDGVTPVPAQISVTGGDPGGSVSVQFGLLTRAACHAAAGLGSSPGQNNGTSFTVYGLPAGRQRATDYYRVNAIQYLGGNNIRSAGETFQQLAGRVIALPPSLGNPAFTTDPGNFRRLRVALTGASEYKTYSLSYRAGGKGMFISASAAYLGTNAVVLTTPSFTVAPGWQNTWAPPVTTAGATTWTISASGRSVSGTSCQPQRSVDTQLSGSL